MKEKYFDHFKLFVVAIYLLNTDSVSPNDVILAKFLLQKFVKKFQDLYGIRNMSFNVHCLRHLHRAVTLLGQVWIMTFLNLKI